MEFDGVFRDAQVFLNGHFLGRFPSGYTSFRCDLTDVASYGGRNVLAVRVDATLKEGWFYEGAGIYRHVWLTKTGAVHVGNQGTFVSADDVKGIDGDRAVSAVVTARVTVGNDGRTPAAVTVRNVIVGPEGEEVAKFDAAEGVVEAVDQKEFVVRTALPSPRLWAVETPVMYRVATTVEVGGKAVDRYETPFGVRTLAFDAEKGFFLNGRHLLIKGTCDHQDHAGVGVALPDGLQVFRLARLKEMGCNAVRTSHNPPTPELLDACDRMGMLVLDENRQTGTSREAMDDLRQLVLRDRNHPSVFLWSVGNEEWAIEGNVIGTRVTAAQRDLVHKLDPTRLVTCAISGGWGERVVGGGGRDGVQLLHARVGGRLPREAPGVAVHRERGGEHVLDAGGVRG